MDTPTLHQAGTLAQTLPEGGALPLVIALAGGVILWLLGGRVLKPAFALIGAALGGFAGVVLVPLTGLPPLELGGAAIGPGFIGLLVGAILGALVSVGLFRVVITLSAGVVFMVAGVMGALVYLQHVPEGADGLRIGRAEAAHADEAADALRRGTEEATRRTGEAIRELGEAMEAEGSRDALLGEEVTEQIRSAAQRSRAFLAGVRDEARQAWEDRAPRERVIILGGGVAGLLAGLIGGVLFPKRATALITALLGAAVWLFCAVALLRSLAGLGPEALAFTPRTWAVLWIGTGVIGMALQLGVIGRRGGRRDSGDDDEGDDD